MTCSFVAIHLDTSPYIEEMSRMNADRENSIEDICENGGQVTRNRAYPENLIRKRISRTEMRNNTFSQRVITHWNNLPTSVKDSCTISEFKTNYDNFKKADSGEAA